MARSAFVDNNDTVTLGIRWLYRNNWFNVWHRHYILSANTKTDIAHASPSYYFSEKTLVNLHPIRVSMWRLCTHNLDITYRSTDFCRIIIKYSSIAKHGPQWAWFHSETINRLGAFAWPSSIPAWIQIDWNRFTFCRVNGVLL